MSCVCGTWVLLGCAPCLPSFSTVLQTKAFRSITNLLASDARRRRIIATVVPPPPTATIRAAAPRLDVRRSHVS